MNLQKELRHKSEDIDDAVLLDVVKALRRRVRRVSHDYDIPHIAGYSVDGKTIFIDRHLPRTVRWLVKTVRVEPFLLTHEIVERLRHVPLGRLEHDIETDALRKIDPLRSRARRHRILRPTAENRRQTTGEAFRRQTARRRPA